MSINNLAKPELGISPGQLLTSVTRRARKLESVEYAKHPPTRIIGADWEVHFRVENISSNLRRAFDAGDATIYMPGTKAPVEEAFTQQAVVQARQLPNAARNSNLVYLFMCFADRPTHLYGKRNTRPRGAEKMVTCNEVR